MSLRLSPAGPKPLTAVVDDTAVSALAADNPIGSAAYAAAVVVGEPSMTVSSKVSGAPANGTSWAQAEFLVDPPAPSGSFSTPYRITTGEEVSNELLSSELVVNA